MQYLFQFSTVHLLQAGPVYKANVMSVTITAARFHIQSCRQLGQDRCLSMFGPSCTTWYGKQAVGLRNGLTASCIQYICGSCGLGGGRESGLADPISMVHMGH
jgi:hypothetical protein